MTDRAIGPPWNRSIGWENDCRSHACTPHFGIQREMVEECAARRRHRSIGVQGAPGRPPRLRNESDWWASCYANRWRAGCYTRVWPCRGVAAVISIAVRSAQQHDSDCEAVATAGPVATEASHAAQRSIQPNCLARVLGLPQCICAEVVFGSGGAGFEVVIAFRCHWTLYP
jgi:hypothetical protein